MSLLDTLRKTLTPEKLQEFQDLLGDDFNYDLVPRSRLNKVISQRDEFKALAETGKQSSETDGEETTTKGKSIDSSNIKTSGKVEGAEELQARLEAEKNQAIQEVKLQYAALEKLRSSDVKCVDPDLAYSLLDKTKIKLDESGQLTGWEDALKPVQESKAYLFGSSATETGSRRKAAESGTGKDSHSGGELDETALDAQLNQVFATYGGFVTTDSAD